MNVKLIAIAALGKNREIGLSGKVPWNLPDEYAQFLETIRGQNVLVGRKNFELHGRQVQGATPLVLTTDLGYKAGDTLIFTCIKDVVEYADKQGLERIYVMGGAELYKSTLPYLSEFLWTEVDYSGPADTYFPEFSHFNWKTISEENHQSWKIRRLVKEPLLT